MLKYAPLNYIVRTSCLYGIEEDNFIISLLKESENKKEIYIHMDKSISPTYTFDLAKGIADMIETEDYGIYWMVNKGVCSVYNFIYKLFCLCDIQTKIVLQNRKDAITNIASFLDMDEFKRGKFYELSGWENALERYLKK